MFNVQPKNKFDSIVRIIILITQTEELLFLNLAGEIYNNTVSGSGRSIDHVKETFDNIVHDNIIVGVDDPEDALGVYDNAGERIDQTRLNITSDQRNNTTGRLHIQLVSG